MNYMTLVSWFLVGLIFGVLLALRLLIMCYDLGWSFDRLMKKIRSDKDQENNDGRF